MLIVFVLLLYMTVSTRQRKKAQEAAALQNSGREEKKGSKKGQPCWGAEAKVPWIIEIISKSLEHFFRSGIDIILSYHKFQ